MDAAVARATSSAVCSTRKVQPVSPSRRRISSSKSSASPPASPLVSVRTNHPQPPQSPPAGDDDDAELNDLNAAMPLGNTAAISPNKDGTARYKMSQARMKKLMDEWEESSSSSSSMAEEAEAIDNDNDNDMHNNLCEDSSGMLARASKWWQNRKQRLQRESLQQQAEEQRQRILQQLNPHHDTNNSDNDNDKEPSPQSLLALYCSHPDQDHFLDSDEDDTSYHMPSHNNSTNNTNNAYENKRSNSDIVRAVPYRGEGLYKANSVDSAITNSSSNNSHSNTAAIQVGKLRPTPSGYGVTVDLTIPPESECTLQNIDAKNIQLVELNNKNNHNRVKQQQQPQKQQPRKEHKQEQEQEENDSLTYQISIEPEPPSKFNERIPYILTQSQMNTISQNGLPPSISYSRWKRIYSLLRDGDSFDAFLRLVQKQQRTLLVIKTTKGDVFGGYADSAWEAMHRKENSGGFYGSAQACLFKIVKHDNHNNSKDTNNDAANKQNTKKYKTKDNDTTVIIYKWTGANRYIQLCDNSHKRIAFGGGGTEGTFGLTVEDDFRRGSTGYCDTFGNDVLCDCGDEHFDVLDLECWGFVTGVF